MITFYGPPYPKHETIAMLPRITPGSSGFDIRTFACEHVRRRMVELVDPMKSLEAADRLRGLHAPTWMTGDLNLLYFCSSSGGRDCRLRCRDHCNLVVVRLISVGSLLHSGIPLPHAQRFKVPAVRHGINEHAMNLILVTCVWNVTPQQHIVSAR